MSRGLGLYMQPFRSLPQNSLIAVLAHDFFVTLIDNGRSFCATTSARGNHVGGLLFRLEVLK